MTGCILVDLLKKNIPSNTQCRICGPGPCAEPYGETEYEILHVYTEDEVRKLAEKGKEDPASLTHDELRAVCLYAYPKGKGRTQ